ncbi:MAG: hypothetical protein ACOH2R_19920 [Pseudomonas sp.]
MKVVSGQSLSHGIVFTVSYFTVMPGDRGRLRQLNFHEGGRGHFELSNLIVDVYEKMYAKELPCVMMLGVSRPLTRAQADKLNAQRTSIAIIVGSVFLAATAPIPFVGRASPAAGAVGRYFANAKLRTYHAGDIIVSLNASVQGGIGPQNSSSSIILNKKD